MDQTVKAVWVAALRSGKFLQGQKYLKSRSGKFCCLGVLRHVMNPRDTNSVHDTGCTLTPEQLAQAGLDPVQQTILWGMNDYEDKSFNEIADYIETEL